MSDETWGTIAFLSGATVVIAWIVLLIASRTEPTPTGAQDRVRAVIFAPLLPILTLSLTALSFPHHETPPISRIVLILADLAAFAVALRLIAKVMAFDISKMKRPTKGIVGDPFVTVLETEIPDSPIKSALLGSLSELRHLLSATESARAAGVPKDIAEQYQQEAKRAIASVQATAKNIVSVAKQYGDAWSLGTQSSDDRQLPAIVQTAIDRETAKLLTLIAATKEARGALAELTLSEEPSSRLETADVDMASTRLRALGDATLDLASPEDVHPDWRSRLGASDGQPQHPEADRRGARDDGTAAEQSSSVETTTEKTM